MTRRRVEAGGAGIEEEEVDCDGVHYYTTSLLSSTQFHPQPTHPPRPHRASRVARCSSPAAEAPNLAVLRPSWTPSLSGSGPPQYRRGGPRKCLSKASQRVS